MKTSRYPSRLATAFACVLLANTAGSLDVSAQFSGFDGACLSAPANLRFFTEVPLSGGAYHIPVKGDPSDLWPKFKVTWDPVPARSADENTHYEVWAGLSSDAAQRWNTGGGVQLHTSWTGSYVDGFAPPFQSETDLGFFTVGTQYFWIRPTILDQTQFLHWLFDLGVEIKPRSSGTAFTYTARNCDNCTPEYLSYINSTLFCDSNFAGVLPVVASKPYAAPENLSLAKVGTAQVQVTWQAVAAPAGATYQVFRADGAPPQGEQPRLDRLWGFPTQTIEREYPSSPFPATLQGTLVGESSGIELLDTPPALGIYTYWVRVKDSAFSSASVTLDVRTPGGPCNQNPANLTATQGAFADKVVLTWSAAPDAIRYIVWRSSGEYSQISAQVGQTNALRFEDSTVQRNKRYSYMVTGVSESCGEFTWSSITASGWPQHLPPRPQDINPSSSPNDRVVAVAISGTDFIPGATVRLTREGEADILPLWIERTASTDTRIFATFDLTGKTAGAWNVQVANFETAAELAGAFNITQGYVTVCDGGFDNPDDRWSPPTVATAPNGEKFLGEFGNETVTLTLDDLPEHSKVRIDLRLLILKTWDGNGEICCGPDTWKLEIDGGPTLLSTSFSNTGNRQAYPHRFPFGSNPPRTGAAAVNTLVSFTPDGDPYDNAYDLTFEFPHSRSNIVIRFTGATDQLIEDESWGLDNVLVRTATDSAAPLPLPQSAHPVYLWTGAVREDSQNWDNPGNWSPRGVPTGNDIAVIGPPAVSGTVNASGKHSIYRIDLQGSSAVLNAADLFVTVLNFGAGTLNGSCLIDGSGTMVWTGGTIGGRIRLLSGAEAQVLGPNPRRLSGDNNYTLVNITVEENARLRWQGPAPIEMYTAGLVSIHVGAEFSIEGSGPVSTHVGGAVGALWLNGSLVHSGAGAALLPSSLVIEHSGIMGSDEGTLRLESRLNLYNGSRMGAAPAGTIELGGTVYNAGTPAEQPDPAAADNVVLAGGTIEGPGTLSVIGTSGWVRGTLAGKIRVANQATFNLTGPDAKRINGDNNSTLNNLTIEDGGILAWTGGVDASVGPIGVIQLYTAPVITVQSGGQFLLLSDGLLFTHLGGSRGICVIEPGATFQKLSGDSATMLGAATVQSSGLIQVDSGVISFQELVQLGQAEGAEFQGPGLSRIDAGDLVFLGNTVNLPGKLEMAGGTLSGTGDIAGPGSFEWTGGQIVGSLTIRPDATLNISGSANKRLNGNNNETLLNLINQGTLNISGPGAIEGYTTAVVLNEPGAVINLIGDLNFTHIGGALSLFRNAGQLQKTGGGRSVAVFKLNNEPGGRVQAVDGTLAWNVGGQSTGAADKPCIFEAGISGSIEFAGGQQVVVGPGFFSGDGAVRVNGGELTFSGPSALGSDTERGNLEIISGIVSGNGPLIASGEGIVRWTGGTISGVLRIEAGGHLSISGDGVKRLTGDNNYGVLNLSILEGGTAEWLSGIVQLYTTPVISNPGGTFKIQASGPLFEYSGGSAGAFYNAGLFVKQAGASETVVNAIQFFNQANGTILSQGGGLNFQTAVELSNGSSLLGTDTGIVIFSAGSVAVTGIPDLLVDPVAVRGVEFTGSVDLHGRGALAVEEHLAWTGGTISGRIRASSGAEIVVAGPGSRRLTGDNNSGVVNITVDENARLRWQGPAPIETYTAPVISVSLGGEFIVEGSGPVTSYVGGSLGGIWLNGTMLRSGMGAALLPAALVVEHSGIIASEEGTLRIESRLNLYNGSQTGAGAASKIELGGSVNNVGAPAEQANPTAVNNVVLDGSTVEGGGTLSITGQSEWTRGTLTGKILVASGGTLSLNGPNPKRIDGNNNATLNNLIVAEGGALAWQGGVDTSGNPVGVIQLYVTGLIIVQPGGQFLLLNDGRLFTHLGGGRGRCVIEPGATFRKSGGENTTAVGGAEFHSSGLVKADSGVISFQELVQLGQTAGTEFEGPGLSRIDSGDLVFLGNAVNITGKLEMAGGTLSGTGAIAGPGSFEWTGGLINGSLTIDSSGTFNISGSASKRLDGNNSGTLVNLINQGRMNISGSGHVQGYVVAVIHNDTEGSLTLSPGVAFTFLGGGLPLLRNDGTVALRSTPTAGPVTLDWNYVQSATGTLELGIVSAESGAGFGRLLVNRTASLDGRLHVDVLESFIPGAGDIFPVLAFSSRQGAFASVEVTGPTVASFESQYTTAALLLTITGQTPVVFPPAEITGDGRFAGALRGTGGSQALLETSTDLRNWTRLGEPLPFTGTFRFTHDQISSDSQRFFRLTILP